MFGDFYETPKSGRFRSQYLHWATRYHVVLVLKVRGTLMLTKNTILGD